MGGYPERPLTQVWAAVDGTELPGEGKSHVGISAAFALNPFRFGLYRFIGVLFGSRNQAKDHGLRTVQRTAYVT